MLSAHNGIGCSCSSDLIDTNRSPRERTGASFAGGGLMGIYHTGVGLAMQRYAPNFMNRPGTRLCGASAGAAFAVCIACGLSPDKMYGFVKECHDLATSLSSWWLAGLGTLHPKYNIYERLRIILDENLPLNAHRLCTGKVHISITLFPSFKNWIVSDFNTRAELIQAILCSSYVPFYCGMTFPKLRGKYCCDGGMSSNIPYSKDSSIITVSPFCGECDICPPPDNESYYQIYFAAQTMNISWGNIYRGYGALFCLPWTEMEAIRKQGYDDTMHFLIKEGLLPVSTQLPLALPTFTELDTPTTNKDESTSDYETMTTYSRSSSMSDDDLFTNTSQLNLVCKSNI